MTYIKRTSAPLAEFLASVAAEIRLHGYRSSKVAAASGAHSTAWTAWIALDKPQAVTDADRATAALALFKARSRLTGTLDSFQRDMLAVINLGSVDRHLIGTAAYIIPFANEAPRAPAAPSEWVGILDTRITVEATVEAVHSMPSNDFGPSWLLKARTDKGIVTTFLRKDPQLAPGDRVTLKGSVKSHTEYNGVKETRLQRTKIENGGAK